MQDGGLIGQLDFCRQDGCLRNGWLGIPARLDWRLPYHLYLQVNLPLPRSLCASASRPSIVFATLATRSLQSNMSPSTHSEPNATGTGYIHSFNQINSHNTTTNITYVDERTKLLNWLSPLQPHVRHNDVRARRQDGLGEWFLQTNEFLRWRDGKGEFGKAALFCSGNPGVGKTFLR